MQNIDFIRQVYSKLLENKCMDIVVIDVKDSCSFAEAFFICTGLVTTHVEVVTKDLVRWLKGNNVMRSSIHVQNNGIWSLVHFGSIVIHIFSPDGRSFYDLDSFWKDSKLIDL